MRRLAFVLLLLVFLLEGGLAESPSAIDDMEAVVVEEIEEESSGDTHEALIIEGELPEVFDEYDPIVTFSQDIKQIVILEGHAAWDASEGASQYTLTLFLNDEPVDSIELTETACDLIPYLNRYGAGSYRFSVTADTGACGVSNSVHYDGEAYRTAAPSDLHWEDTAACWSAVEGASRYAVSLYGNEPVITEDTRYDFCGSLSAGGSYTFSVRAQIGDSLSKAGQSDELIIPSEPVFKVPASGKLGKGEKFTLPVTAEPADLYGALSYKSSNSSIVSVGKSTGLLTAKQTGKAVITVKTENGITAKCKVTVVKAPGKITISKSSASLGVGEKLKLTAKVPSGTVSQKTWESSAPSVAEVDSSGNVNAISCGDAVITVRTYNKHKASCRIKVCPAPEDVAFTQENIVVCVGQTVKAPIMLIPEEASSALTWRAEDPELIKPYSGKIKGLKTGETAFLCTSFNGKTASLPVTVIPAPQKIKLNKKSRTIGIGEQYTFIPTFTPPRMFPNCHIMEIERKQIRFCKQQRHSHRQKSRQLKDYCQNMERKILYRQRYCPKSPV